ncbi:hypothetical protein [Neorhizobium sp. NCHU2750]|uniref:hypothetical protein n=1 Tax=Neorhizobium sp. NCHU2750 TaxID=1825976 RepID=UPI0013C423DA
MSSAFMVFAAMTASSADAQQYQNFEIRRNATGGYTGTLGSRNFDIDIKRGEVSGKLGGQRPGLVDQRPSRKLGNVGGTYRSCVAHANGTTICR